MHIAVCDDEPALRAGLERLIDRWASLRRCPCRVSGFPSGEALLFETAEGCPFDLLLLDIELTGMSGVEAARAVRERDRSVPLAFLTNYPGYVFEGYEVSALRYLLKPVREETLFPLLDLVQEQMERDPACLVLTVEGQARRVDLADILYLEARGHAVLVRTADEALTVKTSFASLAGQLGEGFAAAHRSYLVNLRYVERVGRTACLLENGESVPVSRGSWEKLNRAFIDYYHREA